MQGNVWFLFRARPSRVGHEFRGVYCAGVAPSAVKDAPPPNRTLRSRTVSRSCHRASSREATAVLDDSRVEA